MAAQAGAARWQVAAAGQGMKSLGTERLTFVWLVSRDAAN